VLEDIAFSADITFQKDAAGESTVVGQFVNEAGVARGIGRIHGGRVYAYQADSHERAQQRGRQDISHLVDILSVRPREESVEAAHRLYRLALQRGFTRGRRTSQVAAACLYLVCRQDAKPFLLIDFSDALQVNVFTLGAVFLQLAKLLRLEEHPLFAKPIDPSLYIHRFADRLEFPTPDDMRRVAMTAMRLVASMKRDWIQTGRRPSGICGAALYIAAHTHGFRRTKRDVVAVVHIGEHTLSKRLYEFAATDAGALTVLDFEARAKELEASEAAAVAAAPAGARAAAAALAGCPHLGAGEEHFSHGMCRACYADFVKASGGLHDGANPPAFSRARNREAKHAALLALEGPGGGEEEEEDEEEAAAAAAAGEGLLMIEAPPAAGAGAKAKGKAKAAPKRASKRRRGEAEPEEEEEEEEEEAPPEVGAAPAAAAAAAGASAGDGKAAGGAVTAAAVAAAEAQVSSFTEAIEEAEAAEAARPQRRSTRGLLAAVMAAAISDAAREAGADADDAAAAAGAIVPASGGAAPLPIAAAADFAAGGGGALQVAPPAEEEDTGNLSELSDSEICVYLADPAEVACKEEIWNLMNQDWVEKQAAKRAALEAAERAQAEARAAMEAAAAAGVAYKRARGRPLGSKSRPKPELNLPPAETPQEAAMRMLDHRKLSSKINYSVLADLFADEPATSGGGGGGGEAAEGGGGGEAAAAAPPPPPPPPSGEAGPSGAAPATRAARGGRPRAAPRGEQPPQPQPQQAASPTRRRPPGPRPPADGAAAAPAPAPPAAPRRLGGLKGPLGSLKDSSFKGGLGGMSAAAVPPPVRRPAAATAAATGAGGSAKKVRFAEGGKG
jgi:transcription factor IIIB subunit 2